MAIYVDYEGIKGNVTAKDYEDFMDVMSFDFGVSRAVTMEAGNMSNREATRPALSEITLVKQADNSANALFKESVTGAAGKKVIIHLVQTGAEQVQEFMNYELENVIVSGYSISANSDGDPIETITLSYSGILLTYVDCGADNAFGSSMKCGYNLITATPQ